MHGLDSTGLATVFPFHFAVDIEGVIRQCGPSISRLCPKLVLGARAEDVLRLVRPPMPFGAAELLESAPEFVVIEASESNFVLRGQTLRQGELLFFLGSPWLTSPQQLEEHNLRFGDFALHDPIVDYLSLLETKNTALSDASWFAEALQQSNARLSALIAGLHYGVLTESEEGKVVLTNTAFCKMFGIDAPAEALVGVECARAAEHAKGLFVDPEGFLTGLNERMREAKLAAGDVLELRDGRIFERDYIPIFDGKRHRGQLWQYRDITERRRNEQDLVTARARAEAANEEKSRFLAMMSHEMRTPLGVIVGLADLLAEPLSARDRDDYMRRLRTNASALLTLIDDVLDFSKLEAGRVELQEAPFAPAELLEDVASSMKMRADGKGLTLTKRYDDRIPQLVSGDEGRLRQILINLVNNAIKFTDHGKVEVDVRLMHCADSGVRVRYSVTDTGRGIAKEMQSQIFERFVRVESATGPRAEGTGLGLSICRALIEKMGGQIELTSALGEGSCFAFELDHEWGALGHMPVSLPAPARDQPRKGLVLLAEDDPDNREVMRRMLERAGYEVDTAIDGSLAYEKVRNLDYDLLVTDVQMPTIDGLELTRRIRALEESGERARLPIIAVTAHAVESYRVQGLELGMDAYLTKPIRFNDLVDGVERHIDRRPRVLAIDDSTDSLLITSLVLARTGRVRVLCERDGKSGLARLARTPVDLVLMDGTMPGMSGEATVYAIRDMNLPKQPIIVAMTGHGPGKELNALLAAGCDDSIQKPVDRHKLETLVEKYTAVGQAAAREKPREDTQAEPAFFDEDIFDLVPGYVVNRRADVKQLRKVVAGEAETRAVQMIGHQLRGTGQAYGMPLISEIGEKLQQVLISGRHEEIARLTDQLDRYLTDVERALQRRAEANMQAS